MADYPDFQHYSNIDIIAQSLGEIINRWKFGTPAWSNGAILSPAGTTQPIFSIAGQGRIYAAMFLLGLINHAGCWISIEIDGVQIYNIRPSDLISRELYDTGLMPAAVLQWIPEQYCWVSMGYGYTFESSFVIKMENNTLIDYFISYDVVYALI